MTHKEIDDCVDEYYGIKEDLLSVNSKITNSSNISDSPIKNSISGVVNLIERNIENLKSRKAEKKS